jgi:cell division protease FtsH
MSALSRQRRSQPQEPGERKNEDDRRRTRRKALIFCVLAFPVLIGVFILVMYLSLPNSEGRERRLDELFDAIQQGRVQSATLLNYDNRLLGVDSEGRFWVALPAGNSNPVYAQVVGALQAAEVPTGVDQQPFKGLIVPVQVLLPPLIIVNGIAIAYLALGGNRSTNGLLEVGRSRARRRSETEADITFAEVAGVDEAVEELGEVRDYLSSPERFQAMGALVPKGVLLTGPPGCGKTLLARSLAGEAKVPFFSISGSDFVEIFIGVGAARIRDFFRVAKEAAPCIVFIDELDAVGRSRTTVSVGGQDEREATLNQLLVEMDGFESGSGVVVLAATNRVDILDPALLRPGRFDRRITIDRPDVVGRKAVLAIHGRGKPLGPDVDLDAIAQRTAGFSGADLANVVNEAALLAARRRSPTIEPAHLIEAIERVVAGPERRSRILSPQERHRIAYHEAGHAVVSAVLPGTDRVGKVSIVARGHGGGFTWWVPEGDQITVTEAQLLDRIAAILAGREAERLVIGESSSGAASDLQTATGLARQMVSDFGMSERLGAAAVRGHAAALDGHGPSERLAAAIDEEVERILDEAKARAESTLRDHRDSLDAVAQALLEHESLEGEALDELLLLLTPAPAPAVSD